MHSAGTSSGPKRRLDISDAWPGFGSTKLAAAAIRGAFTLAVLCALLLIAARPAQAQTETALFSFCLYPESPVTGCTDGVGPFSRLTSDGAGNLYGTTRNGGPGGWPGDGTVFELSPNGSGGWNETVLYSFTGGADGGSPYSYVVFDSVGNLYGTTASGGANGCKNFGDGCGVVFELSPVGTSWTETVLYSFAGGTDGADPIAGLILGPAGNLYGTTSGGFGGSDGSGTVFELSPSGSGWTERVIYTPATTSSGYGIWAGLTMNAAGNIFGVGQSTVFELSPNGSGGWNPTVIYTFADALKDGSNPLGTPVLDQAGNLYGTTSAGGAHNYGTVYKLSPGETGWTETILHSFNNNGTDGYDPVAGIVLDAAGNIYGTTSLGGTPSIVLGYARIPGTVFKLVAPVGNGKTYQEKVLSFDGTDGFAPFGSLILDSSTGNLYGTTVDGGVGYGSASTGLGVVFEVSQLAPATTATTLASSLNPSIYGQAVRFTAAVSSAAGTPTGTVIFYDDSTSTTLGSSGTLGNGSTAIWVSSLAAGSHSITAAYQGSATFVASTSAPLNQVVNPATTTTSLASSLNPARVTETVTYTATVASQYGWAATGTVVFQDGGLTIATVTVVANHAAYSTKYTSPGTHSITASYSGDSSNTGSVSAALVEQINKGLSKTVLTTSGSPSLVGQPVTFTATVTSVYGAIPNGETVTFYDGTTVMGTRTTVGGVATFTTSSLTAKTHTIKATYSGDATFLPSSGTVTQVVNKYNTTTALVSSLNPSNYGQAVTLTAKVTPTGPYQPTGTVTFRNGSVILGSKTLNAGGVATLTTPKIPVGADTLTATYGGDAFNGKSVSAAITQTVSQASISMVLTSTPNPSTFGTSVKFTAKLTSNGGLPSGQPVTFSYNGATLGTANVNSTGVATFYTTTLPRGSDVVTAAYAGTVDYSAVSATVTQVVN
jgi:uncharacterized repeat protein (TIGR03803 family)